MHVAILCPGPSLLKYPGRVGFDLVIGVNRAAKMLAVDVWACGDFPCAIDNAPHVIGSPLLLTASNSNSEMQKRGAAWRGDVIEMESLESFCPPTLEWQLFTSTQSLIYAASRGAKRITCYGADWHGTQDCDGHYDGNNRSADRWEKERGVWCNVLATWLRNRGVTVKRATDSRDG